LGLVEMTFRRFARGEKESFSLFNVCVKYGL